MDDNFSRGIDQFWTREVRLDGYGYVLCLLPLASSFQVVYDRHSPTCVLVGTSTDEQEQSIRMDKCFRQQLLHRRRDPVSRTHLDIRPFGCRCDNKRVHP